MNQTQSNGSLDVASQLAKVIFSTNTEAFQKLYVLSKEPLPITDRLCLLLKTQAPWNEEQKSNLL